MAGCLTKVFCKVVNYDPQYIKKFIEETNSSYAGSKIEIIDFSCCNSSLCNNKMLTRNAVDNLPKNTTTAPPVTHMASSKLSESTTKSTTKTTQKVAVTTSMNSSSSVSRHFSFDFSYFMLISLFTYCFL